MSRDFCFRHDPDAIPDGPNYAEYPDEFFPVTYRVRITGIMITNSGWDSDDHQPDPEELIKEMYENGSLGCELVRLTDADPTPPEIKEQRRQENLRKAREHWEQIEKAQRAKRAAQEASAPSEGSFEAVSDMVTGIYQAQGILPGKED